jgi:hypothetical protein
VSASSTKYDETTGVWDVGMVNAGASKTLMITATVDSMDEIVNTATITDVDQPDAFAYNDSATVALNADPVAMGSFVLRAGWNLVSMSVIPDDGDIQDMLTAAGVWDDFVAAFEYDKCTGTWTSNLHPTNNPSPPPPDLTEFRDGYGYWIEMLPGTATTTVTYSGTVQPEAPALPKAYDVCAGWNLIGFKSTNPIAAGDYLNALQDAGIPTWTRIWSFTSGVYILVNSGDMMVPGQGYWLAVLQDGTIYP